MSFEFGNPAYSQSAKGDHRVVVGVAGGNGYQQVPNTPQKTLSAQLADYTNRFKLEEDSVIVLRNVHKTYLLGIEGVPALRGVTVDIKRGEFIVILGKSGGGKTTMLNIMGTIDRPTRGDVYLCGHRVHSKTKDQDLANVRLHRLGFVFQTFNLLPSISAIDNVETPMVLAGKLSKAARRKKAKELLERVGMGGRMKHVPSQLSGGEQQRVTIARSLANDPDILLLDEPTGDLDTRNGEIVLKILNDLNREGVTMVMVTHDVALKAFAHRVLHMVDGKVSRIEEIPREVRQQALKELDESETIQEMLESGALAAAASVVTRRKDGEQRKKKAKTVVRNPTDYGRLSSALAMDYALKTESPTTRTALARGPGGKKEKTPSIVSSSNVDVEERKDNGFEVTVPTPSGYSPERRYAPSTPGSSSSSHRPSFTNGSRPPSASAVDMTPRGRHSLPPLQPVQPNSDGTFSV